MHASKANNSANQICHLGITLDSRIWKPTLPAVVDLFRTPAGNDSPLSEATRSAMEMADIRRGWVQTIFVRDPLPLMKVDDRFNHQSICNQVPQKWQNQITSFACHHQNSDEIDGSFEQSYAFQCSLIIIRNDNLICILRFTSFKH